MRLSETLLKSILITLLSITASLLWSQETQELELRPDGLVLPRPIPSQVNDPARGMLIYGTESGTLLSYNGESWEELNGVFTKVDDLIKLQDTENDIGSERRVFLFGRGELPENSTNQIVQSNETEKSLESSDDKFFFFLEEKGAFCGGSLTSGSDAWVGSNIGTYSFAYGEDVISKSQGTVAFGSGSKALNSYAFAVGSNATASNTCDVAMGRNVLAKGGGSIAVGEGSQALKQNSVAMGRETTANGTSAVAMGHHTIANVTGSTAIGRFNDSLVVSGYSALDKPIFMIGNGTNDSMRSNAMVVRQTGEVEFSNYKFPIDNGDQGEVLMTNGSGQLSWENANSSFECPNGYAEVSNFCISELRSGTNQTLESAMDVCMSLDAQLPTFQQLNLAIRSGELSDNLNEYNWTADLTYTSGIRGTVVRADNSLDVISSTFLSLNDFRCVIEK